MNWRAAGIAAAAVAVVFVGAVFIVLLGLAVVKFLGPVIGGALILFAEAVWLWATVYRAITDD